VNVWTNMSARNRNAATRPNVSPQSGPNTAPTKITSDNDRPQKIVAIGNIVAVRKCARTCASYRSRIARFTRRSTRSSRPYARTTAAPITLSETSESISPTRARTRSYAAESAPWSLATMTTIGPTSSTTGIVSCHE
jgi:hypothetical protein